MKNLYIVFFVLTLVLAFVLRFYALDKVPPGLYQDETAIGYNAYSILKTGKDEYGKSFPLYFKSFGDYKLPVYIYATVPSISVFGLTPFAVRLPSALFGFLTVPVFALFIYQLTKNKNLSLLSTVLLAVTPWHLHYNRATFEVSISLFLFTLGAYLIHKALNMEKARGLFFLGTISFVLGLYTYNLTRLLAPILFILILLIFRRKIKAVGKAELILTFVTAVITLIPFLITFLSGGGALSAAGTLINSSAVVQAPLLEFRSYLVSSGFFLPGLLFNKLLLTLWQYLSNVFSYFSVDFFFISGSPHGNHGIGNVGLFYLFELPFLILGLIGVFRRKLEWGYFLILWAVSTIAVASLTREVPHATRSFFLIVPLTAFIALGILEFYAFVKNKNKLLKYLLLGVILLVSFYNGLYYFASYYFRFPVKYAKAWSSTDSQLSTFLKMRNKTYERIIVDKDSGLKYTSLLFYLAYPPQSFQNTVVRRRDDSEGFSEVKSFGNFEFREVDWLIDYQSPNTLIITRADKVPSQITPLKSFFYPKRPVVISNGQAILQYPVIDSSYVLVESITPVEQLVQTK
ncbi:MAG: glycosyltransferase family 39 protein [Candidatus Levybacteria bacterium]|nr:glycosyltransferase family 39 protein [Candidatus Levybacteria bacterium]